MCRRLLSSLRPTNTALSTGTLRTIVSALPSKVAGNPPLVGGVVDDNWREEKLRDGEGIVSTHLSPYGRVRTDDLGDSSSVERLFPPALCASLHQREQSRKSEGTERNE